MTGTSGWRLDDEIANNWLRWTLVFWLAVSAWFLWQRWTGIYWLALSDTDDNMRLSQVRALLGGQGWFDLRQYKLDPPRGLDIHWSRIVDLPIAGLILVARLFVSTPLAERFAVAVAPLLPMGIAMIGITLTARRLIAPAAWPLALVIFVGATAATLQFMPLRIDHHGWQLACLALTVAGLADPARARGGATVGLASAVSLTIGLELLPYAAMAGAIVTLRWIVDREELARLRVYTLTLGGGSALGFAGFASEANRVLRCDALTPVWLSVMLAAGALLFALSFVRDDRRAIRLALASAAGLAIVAGFAFLFPQCLTRPEQVSPELARIWLNNVREAKPIFEHPLRTSFPIATLPLIGLAGALFAVWRARAGARFTGWAAVALFTLFAVLMLAWQIRAGPAAQLLAVQGATALGWVVLPWFLKHRLMPVRVFGTVAAFLAVSGLFAGFAIKYLPIDPPTVTAKTVNQANGRCPTIPSLRPLSRLPAATIFTHVDLGPRLITMTKHRAIAGPYHRNEAAILDVHYAFGGTPAQFRAIAKRHGATFLLVCPNMAESTNYRARSPNGFYAQLAKDKVPAWLEPVPLPKGSPLRLWRIR